MLFGMAVISFKLNSVVLFSVQLCLREKTNPAAKLEPRCALSTSRIKIAWGPRWDLNHCCSAVKEIGFKFILRAFLLWLFPPIKLLIKSVSLHQSLHYIMHDFFLQNGFWWLLWKSMTQNTGSENGATLSGHCLFMNCHQLKDFPDTNKYLGCPLAWWVIKTWRCQIAWKEWFVVMLLASLETQNVCTGTWALLNLCGAPDSPRKNYWSENHNTLKCTLLVVI